MQQTPNQRLAVRILQWLLVAQRPLRRCEIESGIVLDGKKGIPTRTKQSRDVLSLCDPILEVQEGEMGLVRIFHFTVGEFVIPIAFWHSVDSHYADEHLRYLKESPNQPKLQLREAHLSVSTSCMLYLHTSLDLTAKDKDEELDRQVIMGLHELQLYANDHFLQHLMNLADHPQDHFLANEDLAALGANFRPL